MANWQSFLETLGRNIADAPAFFHSLDETKSQDLTRLQEMVEGLDYIACRPLDSLDLAEPMATIVLIGRTSTHYRIYYSDDFTPERSAATRCQFVAESSQDSGSIKQEIEAIKRLDGEITIDAITRIRGGIKRGHMRKLSLEVFLDSVGSSGEEYIS